MQPMSNVLAFIPQFVLQCSREYHMIKSDCVDNNERSENQRILMQESIPSRLIKQQGEEDNA